MPPSVSRFTPSATTTIENAKPASTRRSRCRMMSSIVTGNSGMTIMSAPPARPPIAATQPVNRLSHDADGGVETNAVIGAEQIVVKCFGHADDGRSMVGQPRRNSVGAVTANRDQRVEMLFDSSQHSFSSACGIIEVEARGAEQRSALSDDAL